MLKTIKIVKFSKDNSAFNQMSIVIFNIHINLSLYPLTISLNK